jgi:branched-chain amino acid transport system permease protein
MLASTLILGLVLGGTYALVAMGLSLQYGIARIMNLAYGEVMVAAAFGFYLMYSLLGIPPLAGLLAVVPAGYALSWAIYSAMMRPLVRRAGGGARLEVEGIRATFGLLFLIQGVMLVAFGGDFASYAYLGQGVHLPGATVAANRLIALDLSLAIGLGLYLVMVRTRRGTAMRAVALPPGSAPLVGIDVECMARQGFALGGAPPPPAGRSSRCTRPSRPATASSSP